ncbi:MAG TPA: serine/threonine-protein kinase [Polyangiaceae bacterium]|nr:serine/threonine-protein kinase [Polyangiaceae bacterium]
MGLTHADEASGARRHYRPLLELGRGGMAKVYLAESLASGLRKLVVLKILNRDLADDAEIRAGFQREAELSARMNHPNVVQVFEVVEFGGVPVIVMEHLDGLALSRLLQHTKLPLRLHLYVLTQVLAGLSHFHELKDIEGKDFEAVHRDVSPQNVLVLYEGPVKVVDFGIAKVRLAPDQQTRTGLIKGKIHYMPPEQLLGESNLDRRADVFAVGVMLWEAIAGRRMWEGIPEATIMRKLVGGELPKLREAVPDVSPILERITERALAPDRTQRYESAEAMLLDLEHALHDLEGVVRPRELTEFMLKHFGDRRQFQQRTIERALREPASSMSGVMECVTPPPVELERASQAFAQAGDDEPLPSSTFLRGPGSARGPGSSRIFVPTAVSQAAPRRRSHLWLPFLGALLLGGAIGGVLLFRDSAAKRATSVAAPTQADASRSQVRLQVLARPEQAEILFDGVRLGVGHVEQSLAPREQPATLEVRLPGYATERRSIRLKGDTSVDILLQPVPVDSPGARSATPPVESERKSVSSGAGHARSAPVSPRARPGTSDKPEAPPPAPASAPTTKEGCNPPYRLGPDGVKTYKAECF